jgi:hypothetical protein
MLSSSSVSRKIKCPLKRIIYWVIEGRSISQTDKIFGQYSNNIDFLICCSYLSDYREKCMHPLIHEEYKIANSRTESCYRKELAELCRQETELLKRTNLGNVFSKFSNFVEQKGYNSSSILDEDELVKLILIIKPWEYDSLSQIWRGYDALTILLLRIIIRQLEAVKAESRATVIEMRSKIMATYTAATGMCFGHWNIYKHPLKPTPNFTDETISAKFESLLTDQPYVNPDYSCDDLHL